ncbi:Lrp/AsnC family transcriptional regulator [Allorhizobium sp. BGMRC 0089]|uniref:Lrp/AsnC family transcriptional regulator n=1 Tax=Allorhizobium sonneratiae TaxID=2934936 RepID=UPI002033B3D9|nr:Lrp/AsnC family transcriptional regulator [Allorhizobium sonneratiae]MCM2294573.1 Lrp/AsnC family transcriptional regulator [Allorhizobium sonneratiae]
MDDLDEKLITLLRHNGRRSLTDLALETGASRATVRARLEKLERDGTILGYTVILRADTLDLAVRGVMMIAIEGHVTDRVIRALSGIAEISAIHTTNGRFDLIVELGARSLTDFDTILHRIRLIAGIVNSETHIILSTPRSTRARL